MAKKRDKIVNVTSYTSFLQQLVDDIAQSQIQAMVAVTYKLVMLYWRTGKMLSEKIRQESWGTGVLQKIAHDIEDRFPGMSGFSIRNLHYMRKFAEKYPDLNCAAAAAQIPWGHTMVLLDKVEDLEKRVWYMQQTLKNGWSRSVLEHWIESDLYSRQGRALTNFKERLPAPQSDLAQQTIKDPYIFSSYTKIFKGHRF
jgi:predicted nuclease of restriction endonuclease-like (RecB) superfamily